MSRIQICSTCAKRCEDGHELVCLQCFAELKKIDSFYRVLWPVYAHARTLSKFELAAAVLKMVVKKRGLLK